MDMLRAGNKVTIRVKNILYPVRHLYANNVYIPEYHEYTGTVVLDKTISKEEIGLTGDSRIPVRRIRRDLIVKVNESEVDYSVPQNDKPVTITVTGSKGDTYVVTKENGRVSCSCPGFNFRRTCKHIQEFS